jgi:hypothetical protein
MPLLLAPPYKKGIADACYASILRLINPFSRA